MKVYAPELDAGLSAAHALAAKIRKGVVVDGDSLRDIYHHGWTLLKTPDQAVAAVDSLEPYGWSTLAVKKSGKQGGRPSEVIRINPMVYQRSRT